jgi:hypothetical protein
MAKPAYQSMGTDKNKRWEVVNIPAAGMTILVVPKGHDAYIYAHVPNGDVGRTESFLREAQTMLSPGDYAIVLGIA